ncbi:hypothetical protein F1880_003171 [Penicillium rolfsii]|nr:hypothetical protein F1880_003171 [Penicillium rolfsii]
MRGIYKACPRYNNCVYFILISHFTIRQGDERIYKRPRTIIPDEDEILFNFGDCSPGREILPTGLQDTPVLKSIVSDGNKRYKQNESIKEFNTNPWEIFEPIAKISQNRLIFHRLVYIEQLDEQALSLATTLNLLRKLHYRSFLNLQESYHHDDSVFFVWEPVEVSISQILASKCMITVSEIIAIVRLIIDGIHFLLRHGRALASLTPDTVFVTQSGNVKIAYALADIVTRLMAKNRSYEWNADIKTLLDDLRTMTIDSLLSEICLRKRTVSRRTRPPCCLDNKDRISLDRLLFCPDMNGGFLSLALL